jgi:L,D-peptidoglycan transpeptidase YkuD (ErfK/YbiS/YcfS/YnhG family)
MLYATGPWPECNGFMHPHLRELIVTSPTDPSLGILELSGLRVKCALGRNGITLRKTEGDGATPAGCWPLRRVLYRPDRESPPATELPVSPIQPHDGWCDDPADSLYNRPVRLPYGASCEQLWRKDRLYDIVVVLGHNDDPVVPGSGSAIFMHLAEDDYRPTAGCIALNSADMKNVLRRCGPGTSLLIKA